MGTECVDCLNEYKRNIKGEIKAQRPDVKVTFSIGYCDSRYVYDMQSSSGDETNIIGTGGSFSFAKIAVVIVSFTAFAVAPKGGVDLTL